MTFILRWKNNNAPGTTVNIYRDTKDILTSALPSPIATLVNGETQWEDTTAVVGGTYWYLATVTSNGKTVATASQKYVIEVKRGMGAKTITIGDDRFGWVGAVPYEELPDASQYPAALRAMFPTVFVDRPPLYKFVRNGKIYYTFQAVTIGWATWADLYSAGLVYGNGEQGKTSPHGNLAGVSQDAQFVHNGDTYAIRLPRGLTDPLSTFANAFDPALNGLYHDDVDGLPRSEFNDFCYHLVQHTPTKQLQPNFLQLGNNYLTANTTGAMSGGGVLCMEHNDADNKVIHRGRFDSTGTIIPKMCQTIRQVEHSQSGEYIPIFELVE